MGIETGANESQHPDSEGNLDGNPLAEGADNSPGTSAAVSAARDLVSRKSLAPAFIFAYIAGGCLVFYGIYDGGIWEILAFTRILDVLIDSGIVAYTDHQMGLVKGLPDLKLYLLSQEPIHWEVLGGVGMIYLAFYLLKMVQFHGIARLYGLTGTFGAHVRGCLYREGLSRILPFGGGDVALISTLEEQGEDRRKAAGVVYVQDMFVWFEIIVFATVGILWKGWQETVAQLFWPLLFLAVLYYVTRPKQGYSADERPPTLRQGLRNVFGSLSSYPWVLTRLCLLSLVCFALKEVTPYLTSQALTSNELILHVPFLAIHGAVLGGYIASRIPITPNGIGQYEFGFAMALSAAGTGFATSMSILVVDGLFRHGVPLLMFAIMRIWHGVESSLPKVIDHYQLESATTS